MNAIVIRDASISDCDQILDILNFEILNGTATFDHHTKDLTWVENYLNDRLNNNFPFIVAIIDNKVVGYATFGPFRFKEGYKRTVEHSIYIHHEYQHKGVGAKLMEDLINIAKQTGIKSLIAGIAKENENSISFHERFGFKHVGSIPNAAFKFDRWLELVFLQLVLE